MTQREFFTAVASANISDSITEYATSAIAKLDEKNAKRKSTGTATQRANVAIKEAIISAMEAGVTYTAAEIVALGIEGVSSTQKVSPLMKQIAKTGKVVISEIKIKGKGTVKGYTLAEGV